MSNRPESHYTKKSYANINYDEEDNETKFDLRMRLNELKNKKDRNSSSNDRQSSRTSSSSVAHQEYHDGRSSSYHKSTSQHYSKSSSSSSSYRHDEKSSSSRKHASSSSKDQEEKKSDKIEAEKSKQRKIMDAEVNEIVSEEEMSNEEDVENENSKDRREKSNEKDTEASKSNDTTHSNKSSPEQEMAKKKQKDRGANSDTDDQDVRSDFSDEEARKKHQSEARPKNNHHKKRHSRSSSKSQNSSNESADSFVDQGQKSDNESRSSRSRGKRYSKEKNSETNSPKRSSGNRTESMNSTDSDSQHSDENKRNELKRKRERKQNSDKSRTNSEHSSESEEENSFRKHFLKMEALSKKDKRSHSKERNLEDNKSCEPSKEDNHEPEEESLKSYVIYYCATQGCRSVEEFECLNKIEEGAYGVVYRAKDKKSNEVVALKRLKMEKEREGFPITSIREVDTLLKAQHPNVVTFREIVVGSNMDKIYMVMDYVEHDLKSLMQYSMKKPFMMAEVKTLMIQLLSGLSYMHDNWIIHRDLKTSNLLLSHKGVLKIADFGLAREYGSPLKEYTPVVVTLWYRSPELLLGIKKYSISIDIWSVGCIFGELMLMKALFPGKNEKDQLDKIFKDLGTPTDKIWPGFRDLPLAKKLNFPEFPYNTLRSRFGTYLSDKGFELINKLLTYNPSKRITAEDALKHDFFKETPLPLDSTIFPTWPAKSEGLNKSKIPQDSEPRAPSAAKMYEKLLGEEDGFVLQLPIATGFTLR